MEVALVNDRSVRIKSKNSTFIVNPEKKIDGDVVILTSKPDSYEQYQDKIVFDGPGEYEVAGVSIKGEKNGESLSFDLLEDNQRVLVITSGDAEKSKEAEDYTATVVFANENMGADAIDNITSGVVIVVGDKVPGEHENIKKLDKLNLKKLDEYNGFIVHLTKN